MPRPIGSLKITTTGSVRGVSSPTGSALITCGGPPVVKANTYAPPAAPFLSPSMTLPETSSKPSSLTAYIVVALSLP